MNANIRRLGFFFIAAFAVVIAGLTYWQVLDAGSITARADNKRLIRQEEFIQRGRILDRNGVVLADRTQQAGGVVGRTYADPSLSQVLGYSSIRLGKTGIESTFDDYLSGREVGTSWQEQINQWEHKPIVGNDVTLTIDEQLQHQVAAILPNTPSSAIVADPRTGEILAMVSKPEYDANRVDDAQYWASLQDPAANSPLINRAVNGYYPPGSTFKLMTISAALDTGTKSLSSVFSGADATGPLTVDSHVFCDDVTTPCAPFNNLSGCASPPITLEQALMCSDNIAFAHVGLALGSQKFLDYTNRFGLDQRTPFDIPVSVSHVLSQGETFGPVELASTAFGQGGLNLTPLQMLLITEAQADGGNVPQPVLVKQVTAPDGSTLRGENTGTLYTPESSATADQVKSAMIQVVEAGSGFAARIPGVQVAGKTGTAQVGGSQNPHAWFVCFAPADHPRVAVVVMIEHGGEGATVAAPLARQILLAALPRVH
jgi:penicillin-binding protein A